MGRDVHPVSEVLASLRLASQARLRDNRDRVPSSREGSRAVSVSPQWTFVTGQGSRDPRSRRLTLTAVE